MGKAEREKGEGSGNGRMREVWREWRQLRGKQWNDRGGQANGALVKCG